jgi:hypothetical protein
LYQLPRPFELYLFSLTVFPKTEIAENLLAKGAITEEDVEGSSTKTHQQLRVSLNFPRQPEDAFWISLLVLLSKRFVSKGVIRALFEVRWLRRHPKPLVLFSQLCNLIKMGKVVIRMLRTGEMTKTQLRRWLNPRSLVTQ